MARIELDQAEIELVMHGLNALNGADLTEDQRTVRAGIAYKLGGAAGDILAGHSQSTASPAALAEARRLASLTDEELIAEHIDRQRGQR